MSITKICKRCKIEKSIESFYTHNHQSKLNCKQCIGEIRRTPEFKIKYRESKRLRRLDPNRRHFVILEDARRSDRRRGLTNNLTSAIIKEIISKPCTYCDGIDLKMSLDRIDNSKGHIKGNVVACCLRCNYMRRDMPYEAWIKLSSSIKNIRQLGLFGNWMGGVGTRKAVEYRT